MAQRSEQESPQLISCTLDEDNSTGLTYDAFQPAYDCPITFDARVLQAWVNSVGRIEDLVSLALRHSFHQPQHKLSSWLSQVAEPVFDCSFWHVSPFLQFRISGR